MKVCLMKMLDMVKHMLLDWMSLCCIFPGEKGDWGVWYERKLGSSALFKLFKITINGV